jgi:hypothetical protein
MHCPIGNCNFKFHMQKGFKNYFTLYWFYCQYLYNWIRNKFLQLTSPSPYKYINNINQICIHNFVQIFQWKTKYSTVTVGTISKSNIKIVERGKTDSPSTQIHDRSISWLGTDTSKKKQDIWQILHFHIIFLCDTPSGNYTAYKGLIQHDITQDSEKNNAQFIFEWLWKHSIPN